MLKMAVFPRYLRFLSARIVKIANSVGHLYIILGYVGAGNAHSFIKVSSLLYKSKGKDHVPSTSQKAGLTGLYKKFLFLSTTAIS